MTCELAVGINKYRIETTILNVKWELRQEDYIMLLHVNRWMNLKNKHSSVWIEFNTNRTSSTGDPIQLKCLAQATTEN